MKELLDYMDIARYLYKNTPRMTNLKLQKMMYLAYIEYFNRYNEELFKDDFEAWVYGPVLPELYHLFYKLLLIEQKEDIVLDKKVNRALDLVIKKYGDKGAFDLVEITQKDPIWKTARENLGEFDLSNRKLDIKQYLNEKNQK